MNDDKTGYINKSLNSGKIVQAGVLVCDFPREISFIRELHNTLTISGYQPEFLTSSTNLTDKIMNYKFTIPVLITENGVIYPYIDVIEHYKSITLGFKTIIYETDYCFRFVYYVNHHLQSLDETVQFYDRSCDLGYIATYYKRRKNNYYITPNSLNNQ